MIRYVTQFRDGEDQATTSTTDSFPFRFSSQLKRSEGAVFAILQVLRNLQASDTPSEEQTAFVAVLERLSSSRQLDVSGRDLLSSRFDSFR